MSEFPNHKMSPQQKQRNWNQITHKLQESKKKKQWLIYPVTIAVMAIAVLIGVMTFSQEDEIVAPEQKQGSGDVSLFEDVKPFVNVKTHPFGANTNGHELSLAVSYLYEAATLLDQNKEAVSPFQESYSPEQLVNNHLDYFYVDKARTFAYLELALSEITDADANTDSAKEKISGWIDEILLIKEGKSDEENREQYVNVLTELIAYVRGIEQVASEVTVYTGEGTWKVTLQAIEHPMYLLTLHNPDELENTEEFDLILKDGDQPLSFQTHKVVEESSTFEFISPRQLDTMDDPKLQIRWGESNLETISLSPENY